MKTLLNDIKLRVGTEERIFIDLTWSNGRAQSVAIQDLSPERVKQALLDHVRMIVDQIDDGRFDDESR